MKQIGEGGAAVASYLDIVGGEVHREQSFMGWQVGIAEGGHRVVVVGDTGVPDKHARVAFQFLRVTQVHDGGETKVEQGADVLLGEVTQRVGAVQPGAARDAERGSVTTEVAEVEGAL